MRQDETNPHAKVAAALRRRRTSYRRAAQKLPVHFSVLQKVATGLIEPNLTLAVAFEREYKIPADSWPSLREPVQELLRLRGAA